MAWGNDILDNMENVEKPAAPAPGDLSALAAAAARLSQCNAADKENLNSGAQSTLGQRSGRSHAVVEEKQCAEMKEEMESDKQPRAPLRANAAPPQDLFFTVPPNCRA